MKTSGRKIYEPNSSNCMSVSTCNHMVSHEVCIMDFSPLTMRKTMSEQNPKKPHGPYVENPYEDVDEKEEEYGDRTDYR